MRKISILLVSIAVLSGPSCQNSSSTGSNSTRRSTSWISNFNVVEESMTNVLGAPDFYFSAKDASGNLYANVIDSTGNYNWKIMRSTDQGATWSVSDNNAAAYSYGWGLVGDPLGNVFALGSTSTNNTVFLGAIRKFDGTTWSDSLSAYQYSTGNQTALRAAAVDASGNIYVLGSGSTASPIATQKLFILQSTSHGATWNLVSEFSTYESKFAQGTAIVVNGSSIYISGFSIPVFTGARHSTFVRKSTDSGTTWTTIYESWDYSQIKDMVAWNNGIAVIQDYYAGSNSGKVKVLATEDDFQHLTELYTYAPTNFSNAYAGSLSVDSRNYLYASGSASDSGTNAYTFVAAFRNGTWSEIYSDVKTNYFGEIPDAVFFGDNKQVFFVGTYAPSGANSIYKIHKATITDATVFTLSPIGNGSDRVSPVPSGAKIVYLSSTLTNGQLGASASTAKAAADAICNSDPHKPIYATGSFKALIVATGARIGCTTADCAGGGANEHTDWPVAASTAYVTRGGLALGTTNAYGLFTVLDTSTILAKYGETAWSGLDQNSANYWMVDTGSNCNNWTSNNSGDSGYTLDPTQSALGDFYSQTPYNISACDVQKPLICVEQ